MQHVYINQDEEEIIEGELCEKEQQAKGYRLIGRIINGKFMPVDRKAKQIQDAFDKDCRDLLNKWGFA